MYQRILVPVDGSSTAQRGLKEAIGLARLMHVHLCLLHVVDAYPLLGEMASVSSVDEYQRELHRHGERVLLQAASAAAEAGVSAQQISRDSVRQRVSDVITEEAVKSGCDLIVMGTHGRRGFARFTLGSDAERVLRHCTVPVLVVRDAG